MSGRSISLRNRTKCIGSGYRFRILVSISTSPPSLACRRSSGVNNERLDSFPALSMVLVKVCVSEHKAYGSDLCIRPSESRFHSTPSFSKMDHKHEMPSGVLTIFPHVTISPRRDSFRVGSDVFVLSMWCKREYSVVITGVSRADIKIGDGSVFETSVISVFTGLEPTGSSESTWSPWNGW